jgi:hypothetical protein
LRAQYFQPLRSDSRVVTSLSPEDFEYVYEYGYGETVWVFGGFARVLGW